MAAAPGEAQAHQQLAALLRPLADRRGLPSLSSLVSALLTEEARRAEREARSAIAKAEGGHP